MYFMNISIYTYTFFLNKYSLKFSITFDSVKVSFKMLTSWISDARLQESKSAQYFCHLKPHLKSLSEMAHFCEGGFPQQCLLKLVHNMVIDNTKLLIASVIYSLLNFIGNQQIQIFFLFEWRFF